jgi:hypothetical protein
LPWEAKVIKTGVKVVAALLACIVAVVFTFDMYNVQALWASLTGLPGESGLLLAAPVAPFPLDPVVMAVAKAYRNARMIADMVLHRIPVGKQKFAYLSYDKRDTFTIPNNLVGRTGAPNKVEFSAARLHDECEGYGLDSPVPVADIDNAAGTRIDPIVQAAEGVARLNALAREKRVVDLVFNASSYAAANRVQLAGDDQWNSGASAANPIDDINKGLDKCVMRPSHMAIGQAAWTALRANPYILKAVHGNAGDAGMASRRAVADLFELEDIYVGQGWLNTAKRGQAESLSRLWGKHCLLFYKDDGVSSTEGGVTFGFTAQWGDVVGGKEYTSEMGLNGGYQVRAGEYLKELLMAPDLAYFIENCAS